MFVYNFLFLLVSSPFLQAYSHSDFLGKMIFLALLAVSICCWSILVHKIFLTQRVRKNAVNFSSAFAKYKKNPLGIETEGVSLKNGKNPFFDLYQALKKYSVNILNKNRRFSSDDSEGSYLSPSDIDSIASHLFSAIDLQTKNLEKNLFILSTIVGLAPLLGLLGTVWGILTTFSELQTHAAGSTNQMVLGGISLALTTTVLGILNAIPALIAYNYLRNTIQKFETEMEGFSNEMLSAVEMQYRKVDLSR
jgi:biopolymer transport protein TolQ